MKTQVKRAPLAQRLKQVLVEGIEYARGEAKLATTLVPIGRSFTGEEVAAIRTRRRISQAPFANLLGDKVKTMQSGDQGVRKQSNPTMRLLQIFDSPEEFRRILTSSD
jgi:DNA-binding transcriptional regulator YiaG